MITESEIQKFFNRLDEAQKASYQKMRECQRCCAMASETEWTFFLWEANEKAREELQRMRESIALNTTQSDQRRLRRAWLLRECVEWVYVLLALALLCLICLP